MSDVLAREEAGCGDETRGRREKKKSPAGTRRGSRGDGLWFKPGQRGSQPDRCIAGTVLTGTRREVRKEPPRVRGARRRIQVKVESAAQITKGGDSRTRGTARRGSLSVLARCSRCVVQTYQACGSQLICDSSSSAPNGCHLQGCTPGCRRTLCTAQDNHDELLL